MIGRRREGPAQCEPVEVRAEDPLFILYTPARGNRKAAAQLGWVSAHWLHPQEVFDYQMATFWCTAEVGGSQVLLYRSMDRSRTAHHHDVRASRLNRRVSV